MNKLKTYHFLILCLLIFPISVLSNEKYIVYGNRSPTILGSTKNLNVHYYFINTGANENTWNEKIIQEVIDNANKGILNNSINYEEYEIQENKSEKEPIRYKEKYIPQKFKIDENYLPELIKYIPSPTPKIY